MYNEGNELCIIYTLVYGSMLITFTVRVTKQHPVNISFLKILVQCIIYPNSGTVTLPLTDH